MLRPLPYWPGWSLRVAAAAQIATLCASRKSLRTPVTRVSGLEEAPGRMLWCLRRTRGRWRRRWLAKAGLILAPLGMGKGDARVVGVEAPKYVVCVWRQRSCGRRVGWGFIRVAYVDEMARWGRRLRVGACAVIEADVVMGDDVVIGAGAKVICREWSSVAAWWCRRGRCWGRQGLGMCGIGRRGSMFCFRSRERLVVEDDVEIGANTTIDRGALGETRIGRGTKIDNLVQVGHNCNIGKDVVIASQVGISGSCVIEDGAILAGQVGLGDHVTVGKGVILGGQGGVYPGKTVRGEGEMFAGTPAEPVREFLKAMARVRRSEVECSTWNIWNQRVRRFLRVYLGLLSCS